MSTATKFIIGTDVRCSEGPCGELRRVVIDPIARSITHLVVEPRHRNGSGHLVPIELVATSTPDQIELTCSTSEFHTLDDAEEMHFIPGAGGAWNYGQGEMLSLPHYPLGINRTIGMGDEPTAQHVVVEDRVPVGEVEIRRGEHVHATDGEIGRVQGLVVDPRDHHVTHLLLDEGHLWGEKQVAIPITAITRIDDVAQVNLTKDEIKDLPPVAIDQP